MRYSKKKIAKFVFNLTILIISILMILDYFYVLVIYPFIINELTGITGFGLLILGLIILASIKSYENLINMYDNIKK